MVQRYDDVGYGVFDMGPDPEGEWVKYEDYAALKEAVENYIDNMDHEFDCEYSLCSDPRIALAEILGRSLSDMQ